MAIFHLHAEVIKRSQGMSVVDIAARRSASTLLDNRLNQTFNYNKKTIVVYSLILIPPETPCLFLDRSILWNTTESIEKRDDAQLARQIGLSLPKELSIEQNISLVNDFIQNQFIAHKMIADLNIIQRDENNFYAYVLLTMRPYESGSFGKKSRDWSHKKTLHQWREAWATAMNDALKRAGFGYIQVDHRSLAAQGIKRKAQPHIGKAAFHAKKRGDKLDRWLEFEKVTVNEEQTQSTTVP